jgi:hypothetical protein
MTAPTTTLSGVPADTPDLVVENRRAIAWDAVIAGALIGLAASICLSVAGAALGFTLADPYEGPSAKSIGIGALIWFFIVNIVGMGIGGYIAGRSALNETTMDVADFRFRCAAHGLTVWAIATVVATVLGFSALANVIGYAANTAQMVAAGGAAGAAAGATNTDQDDQMDMGFHVRQLFGPTVAPGQGQSTQQAAPAASTTSATAAPATPIAPGAPMTAVPARPGQADYGDDAMDEAGNILVRAWTRNGLQPSEKTYLAGLLARHNGISQADAEQRVGEAEQRIKAARAESEKQAKEAADAAAKAGALAALLAFLSLAIGAIASVVGALSSNTGRIRVALR